MNRLSTSGAILSKDPYRLYLRIEGALPQSANAYRNNHWTKNHQVASRWKKVVAMGVELFRPEKPLTEFHVSVIRHSWRPLDYDNLVTSMKAVLDGMKGLIIEDDRWSMTGPWKVDQAFRPKKDGQLIEVWISERENLGKPN